MKFRIFDLNTRRYLISYDDNGFALSSNGTLLRISESEDDSYGVFYKVSSSDFKVQLFTGCYDKYNTEIYEGDKLLIPKDWFWTFDQTSTVYWDNKSGAWYHNSRYGNWHLQSKYTKDYTVIGNIYDN